MATLKDTIESDVGDVFLNTNEFAETIGYKPYLQSWKYIPAIVDRDGLITEDSEMGVLAVRWRVTLDLAMSAVPVVTAGNDYVFTHVKAGSDPQEWIVLEVIDQNDGMWKLAIGEA